MRKLMLVLMAVALLGLMAPAAPAQALLLGFDRITSSSSTNVAAQFSVDVTDAGGGQVRFLFANAGPVASVISEVYFDDGSLLGIASIINNPPGVIFAQPATPAELPSAGNADPDFVTTTGFSADADNPSPKKGIGPGESLGILFNLQPGGTFADVEGELGSGELRLGLHVQAIGTDGQSDSFVSNQPVPEPMTLTLVGGGLLGLAGFRRKFKK